MNAFRWFSKKNKTIAMKKKQKSVDVSTSFFDSAYTEIDWFEFLDKYL